MLWISQFIRTYIPYIYLVILPFSFSSVSVSLRSLAVGGGEVSVGAYLFARCFTLSLISSCICVFLVVFFCGHWGYSIAFHHCVRGTRISFLFVSIVWVFVFLVFFFLFFFSGAACWKERGGWAVAVHKLL
jgi:hypothetical protein